MKLRLHQKWRLLKEGTIREFGDYYFSGSRKKWRPVLFLVGCPVRKFELIRRRVEVK